MSPPPFHGRPSSGGWPLAPALSALALGLALAAAAPVHAQGCAAWPGEPDPLPRVDAADAVEARWAALRAAELDLLARSLEPTARGLAHALWEHAACLDPRRPGLAAARARSHPLRIHRPVLIPAEPAALPVRSGSAWAAVAILAEPVATRGLAPSAAELPAVSEGGDRQLVEAERALREARFEAALEGAGRARAALVAADPATRARLELLAATAALALGRDEEALASAARALRADPELDLTRASPKVRRLFDRVRAGAGDAL